MRAVLFTDPHLGTNRVANTTATSRVNLRQALFNQAMSICAMEGEKICLGDLFDSYSNAEEIIEQGQQIASSCRLVLAGNHDLVARADKLGSLELLDAWNVGELQTPPVSPATHFALAEFNEPYWGVSQVAGNTFYAVPHVTTQELFDQSLLDAWTHAKDTSKNTPLRCLLLHCNYDCDFAEQETALNLTEPMAEKMLEVFDYVFLGHEHVPRDLFGGRLKVIGNTHPTSFSDISNKRVITIKGDQVRVEHVWDAAERYAAVDVSKLQGLDPTGLEFLRITGTVDPSDMAGVSRKVSELWRTVPTLYGINLDTHILRGEDTSRQAEGTLETLPAQIERELAGTSMLDYWHEFKGA